jgi:hypothetical protein
MRHDIFEIAAPTRAHTWTTSQPALPFISKVPFIARIVVVELVTASAC